MDDRPICLECDKFKMRKDGVSGYVAVCTGRSARGRVIDWQYAMDMKWAKKELKDRMMIRISPRWCPMKTKGEKDESLIRNQ